jgi:hypothetical protein
MVAVLNFRRFCVGVCVFFGKKLNLVAEMSVTMTSILFLMIYLQAVVIA